jgi:serine phosphatase RsbU (regulator of sigma subunit)/anti-sigma regulatory factor (Ser/Thr protein kinase)
MTDSFMPHGFCFRWMPGVLALHVVSDALIAFAYFSIPALLVWFVRRRPDVPFSPIFWMFSLFIVSCGLTHVLAIVVIWHPAYWTEGVVKATTAAASVATAVMLVPLLPRALALRSPRELDRVNAALQETLAERESLLRRYERQHHIARTLQDASLTAIPDRIGNFALSAVYRPATGDLEIGGDWYDAFAMPDGRLVVSIGDVTGKGLRASVIMSKVRQALRVAAQIQIPPSAVLDAADRALKEEYPQAIVTAFVAVIDDVEGVITYANAGHPRPLVRLPDGTLEELGGGGLPLGLRQREEAADSLIAELVPGSLIVFYTDGLTESTRDYAAGERRLRDVVAHAAVELALEPAAEIEAAVLGAESGDDVAIMTLLVGARTNSGRRWSFDASDRMAAYETRRAICAVLRAGGLADEDVLNFELLYSELLGNVLRYAGTSIDVRLNWETGAPVLHVLDDGPGFQYVPHLPSDLMAESGRGLYLVTALAEEFAILRRAGGGSHARAVLRTSVNGRLRGATVTSPSPRRNSG